ncbi:MAG: sensor histidine kinase [Acidobacteriota bacterium]
MRLIPKSEELGWMPYAWLIYLSFYLFVPAMSKPTLGMWAATLGGLAVFLVLYFRGFWARGRELELITGAIALLGAVYYPWNPGAGSFSIYASSFAGKMHDPRKTVGFVAVIEIVTIVESVVFHVPWYSAVWPIVFSALIAGMSLHYAERERANARLRLAHDEVEHLARMAERERIARDLHDLLGHTLSLIILKSELASKLADRDVERSRHEIRDVERISREALAQVRAAVRGYRAGGLRSEVEAARNALTSAGVTFVANVEGIAISPAFEAVLALAVREAVTNIVRHAGATRCSISFTPPCVLTIEDDGRGGSEPFGSGLAGMRERVEALGGTLSREGERGTRLILDLPLPPGVRVEQSA